MAEDIEQICCHYEEALAQRRNWVSDGELDNGASTYDAKGCYECGGKDIRCDAYCILPKSE
ncbi:MAG: hypothetical protein OEL87_03555, partial [Nanoarchaeota archaeon]|nr:hypothetical protein [Nanoarchaeota archaeon]